MRHVIFDFFGTLVTYRDGVHGNPAERARRTLSTWGVHLTSDVLSQLFARSFARLEEAAIETLREYSMDDAARMLFEDLGVAVSKTRVAQFVESYLDDWTEAVEGLPNLSNWLDTVPASKSVLSNTHHQPMVEELLDRLGIRASFDHVTTSIGHGFRKPHPSIYFAHLECIGVDASDAIFVGDNVECDYFGPRAVGIEAYLIAPRPVDGIAERHRLTDLYQLNGRLG